MPISGAVAPEFVYRFANYNELVTAPVNTFGGAGGGRRHGTTRRTNAGNASALYLNAMLDLSGEGPWRHQGARADGPAIEDQLLRVVLLDGFINDVGSIGTRTTPSTHAQTYLLVGPTSRYAHQRIARIHGFTYRVMPFDTNRDWMLARIRANSLVPASDPTSVASILKSVVERFGLSTLAEFEARGHQPKYFQPGQYTPTPEQISGQKKWHTAPTNAVPFFKQVGQALRLNPLPTAPHRAQRHPAQDPAELGRSAGQCDRRRYRNPSYGQRRTLALFRPLGLTANGFRIPRNWGPAQINALQAGIERRAKRHINAIATSMSASPRPPITGATSTAGSGLTRTRPRGTSTEPCSWSSAGPPCRKTTSTPQINNLDGTSATAAQRQQHLQADIHATGHQPADLAGRSVPCRRP